MKQLIPTQLTAKILHTETVLCKGGDVRVVITKGTCNGFKGKVFSSKVKVVSKGINGYKVALKDSITGIIAKVITFNTIREMKSYLVG